MVDIPGHRTRRGDIDTQVLAAWPQRICDMRIAKEGRKFGLSLLLASQRPSEVSETVVAQCGTVIAHRLAHEADQNLLRHATALSSRALLDQLPSLAQQQWVQTVSRLPEHEH